MNRIQRLLIVALLPLFMGNMAAMSQTIQQIRQIYAEAKKSVADNGKNDTPPMDIKITMHNGTKVSDYEITEEESELCFYFNQYRADTPSDNSRCYFLTENWTSDGHTRYREMLFDPDEGYLLFSYMRAETHAGFVVESRYYYGADGRLIDQNHKLGGKEATANAQSWSTADGDKELAGKYLTIFDMLMQQN